MPIGTLCAIDTRPREMSPEQLAILRDLASMVETELKLVSLTSTQSALIEELHTAKNLALVDPLTRLWNLAGINKLLAKEGSEAARRGSALSVAMLDIDHFKAVNDTHGHAAGNAVLQGVAKKMLSGLRTEDSIGRIGGEEFLIILTECLPDQAKESMQRLCRLIAAEAVAVAPAPISVTLSAGVTALYPGEKIDYARLMKKADDALYRAKANGRNRVETDF